MSASPAPEVELPNPARAAASPAPAAAATPRRRPFLEGCCPHRLASILAIGLILRIALCAKAFIGWQSLAAMLWGFLADLGFALCFALPPLAGRGRLPVFVQRALTFLFFALLSFFSCVEFFYFDEFGTRADQVVLDYVLYTGEVTGNVFESYPVALIASCCALAGALFTLFFARLHRASPGARLSRRFGWIALGALLFAGAMFIEPPFEDRTTRELAKNGLVSLSRAAVTGELDYASHYSTLSDPLPPIRDFLSRVPGFAGFTDDGVRRRIDTGRPARALNVVLVLAESLGRELTGAGRAGGEKSLTPRFDALAGRALLYDNVYATGTRTARALEGALASFPPVPGNAIVRLRRQRPLDSLASVLADRGYEARFIYGGDLGFDNMRDFLEISGFTSWSEDAGQERPGAFSTSWGAADEFVFERALDDLRDARRHGRPTFLTVLTVSNHRPFLFPEGRVEGAPQKKRAGATRYADFALGRFFDALDAEGFRRDTIVAVIGDHGPRSYTRARMPADAHRVPFLIWGPDDLVVPGTRSTVIGSSIDVAPTLLGLLGGSYEASFFGRDLALVGDGGMALMQDKQDIALRLPGRIVILGFNGQDRQLLLDDEDAVLDRRDAGDALGQSGGRDLAISFFQTAYDLYVDDRLKARE